MAELKHRVQPQPQPENHTDQAALERLLVQLASTARSAVNALLAGSVEARRWPALKEAITGHMDGIDWRGDDITWKGRALADRAYRLLANTDAGHDYAGMLQGLVSARDTWAPVVPEATLTEHLHRALLWRTAWHLLSAGIGIDRVIHLLSAGPARRPQAEVTIPAPRFEWSWPSWAPSREQLVAAVMIGARATSQATIRGVLWLRAAYATRRAAHLARVELGRLERERNQAAFAEHTKAVEQEEVAKRAAAAVRAVELSATLPATSGLDGAKLNGSVVGTWLGLVAFSLVSLIWGALISIPFGVGMVMIASIIGGFVYVPLWGTLFGFLGMNAARDSTIGGLAFKPLPDDHPMRATCARFAADLNLPMPTIGTIGVFNALAMGASRKYATVALGRPLLEKLTEQEAAAVLGHELGHVVSGDMRRMMLMRTFQNALVWYAGFQGLKIFVRWILCWATELWILAFSRRREYWADAIGAALAGKEAMIGALTKLNDGPALTPGEKTHSRFMVRGDITSTHPGTNQRIKALEAETYLKRLPRKSSPTLAFD